MIKRLNILYLLTCILAFCSIVYELILAQALSAFLDNTVLRYSVTIGLYMWAMGLGALLAGEKFMRRPVLTLLSIEIMLTVIGGCAVILLHLLDAFGFSRLVFSISAYALIIVIGVLTGFEIPLLMKIVSQEKANSDHTVLALDYLGALAGTIVFAFVFYPKVGLMPSAFCAGCLNALAGLLLFTQRGIVEDTEERAYRIGLSIQFLLLIMMVLCLFNAQGINQYFINQYLV